MTSLSPPPTFEPIADQVTTKVTLPWLLFFNDIFNGDQGQFWQPTFTGLSTVGTPVINGVYYQIGALVYFRVDIIPATSTSATSGATYINNFPLVMKGFGLVGAVTNAPSAGLSMADNTTNRIYTPTWTAVTSQVTIVGLLEAS